MTKRQSWNPLDILNDIVDGKIFDGEFSPEKEVTLEPRTEETRQTPRQSEQTESAPKRKPAAESLAETFTGTGASIKSGAIIATVADTAPAKESDSGESDGAA